MATATTGKTKTPNRVVVPAVSRRCVTVLVTHPIQYQAPLFRVLAEDPALDFRVLFLDDHSLTEHHDPGFGVSFAWDVPLVDGYSHEFLVRGRRAGAQDLPRLIRHLRANRADVLWVHGWGHPLLLFALASRRLLADRILVRAETRLDAGPNGRNGLLRAQWHTGILAGVDGALAIGRDNQAFLEARGVPADRIFRMPYAVDAQRFGEAQADRAEMRRTHGLSDSNLVLLFCGKLRAHKAPLDLAHATVSARAKGASVEAWFVGTGPQAEDVQELMDRADGDAGLRLLGFQNQSVLPSVYAGADVLCLPSLYEPWGLVANEGAHAGLALLLSDQVGSALDLVLEGETGWTHRAGDRDALESRIMELDADRVQTRRLGERARALASGFDFASDQRGLHAALTALFS